MQEADVGPSQKAGIAAAAAVAACALLICALFLPFSAARAAAPVSASIVIDAASGEVLAQDGADLQTYPASLTKMMTLYLAFEALQKGKLTFNQALPVSAAAAAQPATKLGLSAGSTITVSQAIRGMIIKSANDAAVVMAEGIGGSVQAFAQKMNAKAQALGMSRSYFRNPNGLPDLAQHTTARDLVRLAAALYRDFPQYAPLFAETRFTFQGRTFLTHNRFVLRYPGADGLKTGFINASGFNLAASAVRNGRRIIGVVLGGRSPSLRDAQMWALLDRGFGTATPKNASNTLLLASAPGVIPSLKPEDGEDGGAEDDSLEDGSQAPLVAATKAATAGSMTIADLVAAAPQASVPATTPQASVSTTTLPAPIVTAAPQAPTAAQLPQAPKAPAAVIVQMQIPEPPPPSAAPTLVLAPLPAEIAAPAKPAATAKATKIQLAAAAPPQLKPILVSQTEGEADGVMPLSGNVNRNYGIQVGAYSRYSPARQAALKAQQNLPIGSPPTRVAVDESSGQGGRLYRARLIGLAQSEANDACRALKARQLSCLVVQSNLSVAETPQ
jgi:D-alanyl-D-alanine carboxypeptidase